MADWLVPLSDIRFSEAEVDVVAGTYRSGWLSQGPRVAAFEARFAALHGGRHAIAVASGTAALQLACAAIDLRPGDEVVVPSLTFAATAAAVVHAGATPVFADIGGLDAPWLSPETVTAAIGPRTRAIIAVAYGGDPGATAELRALAEERGLTLIEDAAHALGAARDGAPAGTIGHIGAFSFFANKNLALGEGGMVLTPDPALAARVRLLRSHGLSSDTWARHRGDDVDYDVLEPGFNFRLDEARAALGSLLLDRLGPDNDARAAHARAYLGALAPTPGARPVIRERAGVRCAWHIFPVLLEPGVDRVRWRGRLRERGVQTSVHYPPLHLTRAFGPFARGALECTADYARRTVTLPMFPHMSAGQLATVVEAVGEALVQSRSSRIR